ncbi:MAG: energy transducer TonB [Chitinophagaceae bacterium]
MKFLITLVCTAFVIQTAFPQNRDKFFAFDASWQNVKMNKAYYLVRVRKNAEKDFLISTYLAGGPCIMQEKFKDDSGTVRNGNSRYYHSNGYLDSVGNFTNNLADGQFDYFDLVGRFSSKKWYSNGIMIRDSLFDRQPTDSTEVQKVGTGETVATFKGGPNDWMRFLSRNLKSPEGATTSSMNGVVNLIFVVDEKGKVLNPEIFKSAEYSMDEETLRLIRSSPDWVPASKDGVPIKSYKRQSVSFQIH